jgi:hypothetical protein
MRGVAERLIHSTYHNVQMATALEPPETDVPPCQEEGRESKTKGSEQRQTKIDQH